mmetsp:Transcript_9740/g.18354  ORF Transcript_9740/g.18354 Transcript_9740/m.18354 type:complete len:100 (+) Transcript_9740:3-302(+)
MWFFPPDFVVGGSGIFYHAGEIEFDAALLNISNYEWGLGTWRSLSPHTKRKEFFARAEQISRLPFLQRRKIMRIMKWLSGTEQFMKLAKHRKGKTTVLS